MAHLYDPPENGLTPLNGAGEPRSSPIPERDVAPKLEQGYTREPLLPAPPTPEPAPKQRKR